MLTAEGLTCDEVTTTGELTWATGVLVDNMPKQRFGNTTESIAVLLQPVDWEEIVVGKVLTLTSTDLLLTLVRSCNTVVAAGISIPAMSFSQVEAVEFP